MEFKSTVYLQHTSILKVMAVLGYTSCGVSANRGFKKNGRHVEGENFISFKDAQNLHNGITVRVCGNYWDMLELKHLQLPQDLYQLALQEKLVECTYLQKVKPLRGFSYLLVQQNQVKFTDKGKDYILTGKAGSVYNWAKELFEGGSNYGNSKSLH
ncbi:hypothetical protein NVP1063O_104 [Vibrio phage 1.063.O._10N.261.45.C7]|nr:hypothetical protein NVP1063O_104 [Vibrio phage 1.063.O._10N.261.45.C7]